FEAATAHTAGLRETLYREMIARLDPDDSSVPYQLGSYWYYSRFEEGLEYAIHARRKGSMDADEEILLDCNERAAGHAWYALGGLEVSDDHCYMAIAEDTVSRGMHQIRILDLKRGRFLPEVIEGAAPYLAWSADGYDLFYLEKHPKTLLAYRMMRHRRGTDSRDDILVYEEADNTFYTSLGRSRSRDYIFLYHYSSETTEVQLLPAGQPRAGIRPFLPRRAGHEYDIDHANGHFYVRSNLDAVNFRVLTTTLEDAGDMSKWRELVPARDDAMVESIQAFNEYLVVGERQDGLCRVRVIAHDGSRDEYLPASEDVYAMWPHFNVSTHTACIRYAYSSPVTPTQVLETDLQGDTTRLLKQDRVGGGFASENFRTHRHWVTARDGTRVPVSLVRHKDTALDGSAPGLIYGYGAYGHSMDPVFRTSTISLLERGFVHAIAHVRGGEEMGRGWYEKGKKLFKFNSFYDFIDVTHELQASALIDPQRTYAMGGSAGGLLVGAVLNEAPELFHGAVAQVPFVDVVTTMLDESIPLTTGEFDEWGNPQEREYYEYILSYSPYDQVRTQAYPHLLVTSGLHDSQVQYWEPAKWVAKLREMRSNDNQLLLYTDLDSGHGGTSGRYQRYRDIAREYAFLVDLADQRAE
ncbi:MAG: S9 family peptidase, partial [Lysobacterales bacterium]